MKRPSMKSRVQARRNARGMSGAAGRFSICWEASRPWSELSTVSAQARWRWQRPGPGQPGPGQPESGSTRVSGSTSHGLRAARPAGSGAQAAGPRAGGYCRGSAEAAARAAVRAEAGDPAADQGAAVWAWDGAGAPGQALPDRPGARAGALCPQAAVWGAEGAVRELVRARVDGAPAQEPVRAAHVVACGGSCRTGHTVQRAHARRAGAQEAGGARVPPAVREGASGGSSRTVPGLLEAQAHGQARAAARGCADAAVCGQLADGLRASRQAARLSLGGHAGDCESSSRPGSGGGSQGRSVPQAARRFSGVLEPKATAGGCAGSAAGHCASRPGLSEEPCASTSAASGHGGGTGFWLPSPWLQDCASCTAGASCAKSRAKATGLQANGARSRGWENPGSAGFQVCSAALSLAAAGRRSGTSG
jgi:hypothetical protein